MKTGKDPPRSDIEQRVDPRCRVHHRSGGTIGVEPFDGDDPDTGFEAHTVLLGRGPHTGRDPPTAPCSSSPPAVILNPSAAPDGSRRCRHRMRGRPARMAMPAAPRETGWRVPSR